MKFEQTEQDGCALLKLKGTATIENATILHQEILFALADSKGLILDLSAVTECDTTALQIFYAARLSAQKEGKRFQVLTLSRAAADILEVAGFSHIPIFEGINIDSTTRPV